MFKKLRSATTGTHKNSFRLLTAFITVLFLCSVTVTSFAETRAYSTVEVVDGTESVTVSVQSTDPESIVATAGFILNANDELILDGYSESSGGKIIINRAKIIRIEDGGFIGYYVGYDDTLGEILEENGVVLNEGDVMAESESQDIYDGMRVYIDRAFGVGIEYDNKAVHVSIAGGTVADALEAAGITVSEHDVVVPSLDSELSDYTTIRIQRVTVKTVEETEEIAFETERVTDNTVYVGETVVETEGVNGEKTVYYTEKYVDGVLVDKVVDREEITVEPVNEVIRVGTKKVESLSAYKNTTAPISELDVPEDLELDENGIPTEYSRKIEGKATAYTGDTSTSTGRTPMPGHIAVDPNEIPYGTELYVVSADGSYVYGYCIAADTGGFVERGNTDIDLYMDNDEMCYNWGNRDVIIYVL